MIDVRSKLARVISAAAICVALGAAPAQAVVRGKPVHAMAMYGEPKYGPGFTHFDYANPQAPKGGTFVKANEAYLTFDTFNPYTVKGAMAQGLELLLFETLMTPSQDEPSSVYGLIAETAEVAPDNSWVQFVLRPNAAFSDGKAITAEDVVFSYETVIAKAFPRYKSMYGDVAGVEARDARTVRFTFKTTANRKLPMLLAGYLPILSKAYWKDRDFSATTLDIPVSSGPYAIESFAVGKYIQYKRRDDYWGRSLPVNAGLYNFDRLRMEYFRDDDVKFEAFKNGSYDFLRFYSARRWTKGFDFPAFLDGRVKRFEHRSIQPVGVQTLILNLRHPLFQDRRVRQALNAAFDFESLNANLFYGSYVRLHSYWQGSPLEATDLPGPAELALLEPFRDKVPPEVFTASFTQPTTQGTGNARDNLLMARTLLADAGWEMRDGRLVNRSTGEPFVFEILEHQQGMETIHLPYIQNLKRLGIEAKLRMVDTSQYINRVNAYDFDATTMVMSQNSLTPGNDQAEMWGSAAADVPGASNYSGVKDPVVDALIATIGNAETYEAVTAATKALDRVLTWNFYQVMTYSSATERYGYQSKLRMPDVIPALGLGQMGGFSVGMGESVMALWWMDPDATGAPTETTTTTSTSGKTILALVFLGLVVVLWVFRRRVFARRAA